MKKPPAFETIYRRLRRDHQGRDLYLTFCQDTARIAGRKWSRPEHGESVWVWEQNELKSRHEDRTSAKQLCFNNYLSHFGGHEHPAEAQ